MLLFYYNVRVLRFIVRAALPPITDNLRAAQSPTHSANIRKCEIITKFAIINGDGFFGLILFKLFRRVARNHFAASSTL